MQTPSNPLIKLLIIGAAVVVLFGILYFGTLTLYQAEDVAAATQFSSEEAGKPGHIAIDAKLVSVDPLKGDLLVRLQLTPHGDLSDVDGLLTKELLLDLNSATGKTQVSFEKGERMSPADVVLDVYGAISDYPFDSHVADLIMV